jgi:hypothetical protein
VTPSAWSVTGFQLPDGGSIASKGTYQHLGANFYYNAGWKYAVTGTAAKFSAENGTFQWNIAGSGTAGNAITFTQAMTLDASGNLGVGTTSPSSIGGSITTVDVSGAAGGGVRFQRTSAATTSGYIVALTGEFRVATADTNPLTLFTNNTERARITSGGALLVGATSVSGSETLRVYNSTNSRVTIDQASNGLILGADNSGPFLDTSGSNRLAFFIAGTERARITSGGAFYVGTTTAPTATAPQQVVKSGASDWVSYVWNSNAAPYGLRVQHDTDTNGTGNQFLFCAGSPNLRAEIRSNGGLANYSANDVNLSDRREKTNFAPAKSYLDTICAIPVQTFNYIDQSENDPGLTLGVVAQDVQAVAPELVMESNWGTEDNPKMRLSIYQTDLQYALMKCIQEQQALIQSLTARVALLEGN